MCCYFWNINKCIYIYKYWYICTFWPNNPNLHACASPTTTKPKVQPINPLATHPAQWLSNSQGRRNEGPNGPDPAGPVRSRLSFSNGVCDSVISSRMWFDMSNVSDGRFYLLIWKFNCRIECSCYKYLMVFSNPWISECHYEFNQKNHPTKNQ